MIEDILGRVATLEFRLEDMQNNAIEAQQSGHVPLGSKLYTHTRIGRPVLLKREVIATGDQLTNATSGQSQEGPAVNIKLADMHDNLTDALMGMKEGLDEEREKCREILALTKSDAAKHPETDHARGVLKRLLKQRKLR